jgi:hypothetical protein
MWLIAGISLAVGVVVMRSRSFDDFWNRIVPRSRPNPYGHIDTTPEPEWTEDEIEAGRTLERATRRTGGGRY